MAEGGADVCCDTDAVPTTSRRSCFAAKLDAFAGGSVGNEASVEDQFYACGIIAADRAVARTKQDFNAGIDGQCHARIDGQVACDDNGRLGFGPLCVGVEGSRNRDGMGFCGNAKQKKGKELCQHKDRERKRPMFHGKFSDGCTRGCC